MFLKSISQNSSVIFLNNSIIDDLFKQGSRQGLQIIFDWYLCF